MQFAYHPHDRDEAPTVVGKPLGSPYNRDPLIDLSNVVEFADAAHGEDGNRPVRFHEVPLIQDSSPFPTAEDTSLRSYTTAGGRSLVAYEAPEDGGTFYYCAGCGTRQDQSYGWAEKTFSGANAHAQECRATGNKAVA